MELSSIFFDEDHNEERWFDDVKTYIDDNYSFLEEGSLHIDYDPKSKNHKLIGNTRHSFRVMIYIGKNSHNQLR